MADKDTNVPNKTDFITREAAIEQTCFNCAERERCNGICDDTDRIRAIPAADVRPVVRGRWHDVYTSYRSIVSQTCSVCGKRHDTTVECAMPDYCPNCEADMRDVKSDG